MSLSIILQRRYAMSERCIMVVRTSEELSEVLRFYQHHREDHPLPAEWQEDFTKIDLDGQGNHEIVFTRDSRKGTLTVEVDLGLPRTAEVFITDHTGDGLG